MNRQLQARLTGALLLLTLAVIFLPMIFTAKGLSPITPQAAVRIDLDDAPAPGTELLDTEDEEQWQFWQRSEKLRQNLEDSTQVQDFLLSEEALAAMRGKITDAHPNDLEGTAFSTDGIPVAWAVQVGSFRNKDNALSLQATLDNHPYLKDEGHGATLSSQLNDAGEAIYRVAVGPFLDRRTAEKVQIVLARDKMSSNAVIRQFSLAAKR